MTEANNGQMHTMYLRDWICNLHQGAWSVSRVAAHNRSYIILCDLHEGLTSRGSTVRLGLLLELCIRPRLCAEYHSYCNCAELQVFLSVMPSKMPRAFSNSLQVLPMASSWRCHAHADLQRCLLVLSCDAWQAQGASDGMVCVPAAMYQSHLNTSN